MQFKKEILKVRNLPIFFLLVVSFCAFILMISIEVEEGWQELVVAWCKVSEDC